jgi:hypothetical protein
MAQGCATAEAGVQPVGQIGTALAPQKPTPWRCGQTSKRIAHYALDIVRKQSVSGGQGGPILIGSKLLSPASAFRPPRGRGGAARWCAATTRGTDMTESKSRASATQSGTKSRSKAKRAKLVIHHKTRRRRRSRAGGLTRLGLQFFHLPQGAVAIEAIGGRRSNRPKASAADPAPRIVPGADGHVEGCGMPPALGLAADCAKVRAYPTRTRAFLLPIERESSFFEQ